MDTGFAQNATHRNSRAWLASGPVDRSVGDGLTFVASAASAQQGKGSWILRFRFGGRQREKVLGRYPEMSLKEARELARSDRAQLQQGTDVATAKQLAKLQALDVLTVASLSEVWYERKILGSYKPPEGVERVVRRHIRPVVGKLPVQEVRPNHIDRVLTKIVDAGAPTVANNALRYLVRMFHFAVKRRLIDTNPADGFDVSDAGGAEASRIPPQDFFSSSLARSIHVDRQQQCGLHRRRLRPLKELLGHQAGRLVQAPSQASLRTLHLVPLPKTRPTSTCRPAGRPCHRCPPAAAGHLCNLCKPLHCGTCPVAYGAPFQNDPAVPNLISQRHDPTLLALGEALRLIRKAKSVSQENLALLAGVDRSYVGRVERGDNNVAVLTLVRLAAALDISIATLMEPAGL